VLEAPPPKLAAYKIPKYIRTVAELSKTATGKIRKRDLCPFTAMKRIPHDDKG
jgi:acyl-coenzyme A synthetase/AMP-(fatty) acid ligase